MAKLQILACGLAVHWEGQRLVQHSKPLMRNWEVGNRKQIAYALCPIPRNSTQRSDGSTEQQQESWVRAPTHTGKQAGGLSSKEGETQVVGMDAVPLTLYHCLLPNIHYMLILVSRKSK